MSEGYLDGPDLPSPISEILTELQRLAALPPDKRTSLVEGGGRPDGSNAGHYYAPAVLGDVSDGMRVAREEIFGPVVSLMTFASLDEAVARANDTDAGLASYVFTRDIGKADRVASRLRFGEVQVNGVKYDIELPHGGIKQSGMGHDCSALALDDYLVTKRITRALVA